MTFRTRTTVKPTRRRAQQSDTRRAVYINLMFGFVVVASLAVMGGIVFSGYYGDHWTAIASVNGQAISKDDVRARAAVNLARYDREIADFLQMRNQGAITSTEYDTIVGGIRQNEADSTLYSDALNQLTREAALEQYAGKNGITVTDKQTSDQIIADGTIDEQRHVMVIGQAPVPTPPAASPTPAEIQAAQTTAKSLHDDVLLKQKTWDVAYKASNGGTVSGGTTGDLFLNSKKTLNLDPALVDAVFSLQAVNDVTDVIKCSDGMYRFATVTEIVPSFVDNAWQKAIDQTADDGAYRRAARAEALQIQVQNSIEGQYVTGASVQRQVQQITISAGFGTAGSGDEIKMKMMTFAPRRTRQSTTTRPGTPWVGNCPGSR